MRKMQILNACAAVILKQVMNKRKSCEKVKSMEKTVCVYQLQAAHQPLVMELLKAHQMRIIELDAENTCQKIGVVLGLDEIEEAELKAPVELAEELLFFAHTDDAEVDQIVKELKAAYPFTGIVAMLTEHNRAWYFSDFFAEVALEHQTFRLIDELHKEMKLSEQADPSQVKDLETLNQTLMEAFLYLRGNEAEIERLASLIERIKAAR